MTEATIGALQVSKQNHEKATLQCYCPKASIVTIDLLDHLGRLYLHKRYDLPPGESEISLPLQRLPAGDYNAWVNVGEQTAIRQLQVTSRGKFSNFFQRFLQFF